jgi:hypothetical protein
MFQVHLVRGDAFEPLKTSIYTHVLIIIKYYTIIGLIQKFRGFELCICKPNEKVFVADS